MVTFSALKLRFESDRADSRGSGVGAAESRLATALEFIGWRAANGVEVDELAPLAAEILLACITDHHDVSIAIRDLAILMHACAAPMDGSMYPASAFEPAAEEVLSRYAAA